MKTIETAQVRAMLKEIEMMSGVDPARADIEQLPELGGIGQTLQGIVLSRDQYVEVEDVVWQKLERAYLECVSRPLFA